MISGDVFVHSYEKDLKTYGFLLAFCAIYLYNETDL